jgi:hypothetical protein
MGEFLLGGLVTGITVGSILFYRYDHYRTMCKYQKQIINNFINQDIVKEIVENSKILYPKKEDIGDVKQTIWFFANQLQKVVPSETVLHQELLYLVDTLSIDIDKKNYYYVNKKSKLKK